jgi:hypothetical protein
MQITETEFKAYKLGCFERLGFSLDEAVDLVEEGYDWHELDRLLAIKCPRHLAVKICAPLHSTHRGI